MPSAFGEAPVAKSLLDFQRVLSPTAGVRVSPLCLGAMNFGDAWSEMMGKCDKKTVFEILDFFYDQGGNFIDTYVVSQRLVVYLTDAIAVQTITRTKSLRPGSASGCRSAAAVLRWSWPQSSRRCTLALRPGLAWQPTSRVIRRSLSICRLKLLSRSSRRTTLTCSTSTGGTSPQASPS